MDPLESDGEPQNETEKWNKAESSNEAEPPNQPIYLREHVTQGLKWDLRVNVWV